MADDRIVIPAAALRRALLGVLALILVVGAGFLVYTQRERLPLLASGPAAYIDQAAYQAVFLSGSQVFFGRLSVASPEVYLLSDVYYLDTPPQGERQGRLLKRGGELHGPREPMIIDARQVLIIENVRGDSEVMTAIRRFQRGEAPSFTPTPRPSPTR